MQNWRVNQLQVACSQCLMSHAPGILCGARSCCNFLGAIARAEEQPTQRHNIIGLRISADNLQPVALTNG